MQRTRIFVLPALAAMLGACAPAKVKEPLNQRPSIYYLQPALILADLAPERRAEFFARSDQAALYRVIGGVHHPSDIEAGKKAAETIYARFLKNPAFRAELENLRKNLKK